MSTSESKKIILKSSEGEEFVVDEAVALQCQTIKNIVDDEDLCVITAIPLPNVSARILAKVIEYCKKHVGFTAESSVSGGVGVPYELKAFDTQFVRVDEATLYELTSAANYLDIKNLLELLCKTIADMLKGKTPEQIRRKLNIKNDFTPEEEAAIRKQNQWAFE